MTTALTVVGSPDDDEPDFRYVVLPRIIKDPRVQRGLDTKRAEKMAKDFRIEAFGTIILSERADGSLVVLDGQHRVAAAIIAGYQKLVPARVYQNLTVEQEGEMFLKLNETRVVTPVAKFKVGVQAGKPDLCAIDGVVRRHGWQVEPYKGPGKITAAAALVSIYGGKKVGSKQGDRIDLIDSALGSITAAWGKDADGVASPILLGVASVYARYGAAVDSARITSKLARTTPRGLLAQGAQAKSFVGGTEYAGIARWLVTEYNTKIKNNRLPDWQWLK